MHHFIYMARLIEHQEEHFTACSSTSTRLPRCAALKPKFMANRHEMIIFSRPLSWRAPTTTRRKADRQPPLPPHPMNTTTTRPESGAADDTTRELFACGVVCHAIKSPTQAVGTRSPQPLPVVSVCRVLWADSDNLSSLHHSSPSVSVCLSGCWLEATQFHSEWRVVE